MRKNTNGFTIVELLIVIVVIGILAAITIVAYNGVQARARSSKISSDLTIIQKAIFIARINTDAPLYKSIPISAPEGGCLSQPTGTDLATLPRSTDSCWTAYDSFLDKLSIASNINVRNFLDPWGRPYYVNPNEDEGPADHVCMSDQIGTYSQPFIKSVTNVILVPLYKTTC